MSRTGRGKMVVSVCLLGMVCLAGLGCNLSINFNSVKPPPPLPLGIDTGTGQPAAGQPADTLQTAFRPGPESSAVQLADTGRMPLGPETKPAPEAAAPRTDCPGCVDGNVAMHPAIKGQLGKGAFQNENYNRLPTEMEPVSHPPYIVEPPDILLIDAGRLVPKSPYYVQPLDILVIQLAEGFPNQPITGQYTVDLEGRVSLGFRYGTVKVAGLPFNLVRERIEEHLRTVEIEIEVPGKKEGDPPTKQKIKLKDPRVTLGLAALQTVQQVRGEHLVRADGTISLGVYGCVYVGGMNLCQAQTVIEQHLAQFFQDPEISLDVFAYNSKVYYVIVDGGGFGMQVVRFPVTGKETVLDAIERIGGLPAVASRRRIWVARPTPANHDCNQLLPVDWLAITMSGSTRTNYQLFAGDRVYVKADPLIRLDNFLAKVISPIQRLLSVTLLGTSVVNQFSGGGGSGSGVGFVTGF